MTARIVVLGSGRGSNFGAILEAARAGRCAVDIGAVISDRPSAPILQRARDADLVTAVVPFERRDRAAWDAKLADVVAAFEPDVVVLAGFMRILGSAFVHRFSGRILNVHPSLLPSFTGSDAPAQALAAGVRLTGCTVHIVDEGVDTGPILAQAAVPVRSDDTPDSLHRRIQGEEHVLLPATLHAVATGALLLGTRPEWKRE